MLQLPISSGSHFYFILYVICFSYDLVRFMHKTHLVRPRQKIVFQLKIYVLCCHELSWKWCSVLSDISIGFTFELQSLIAVTGILAVTQPSLPSNSQHESHIIYRYCEQHITRMIEMYIWHPQIQHFSKYIQYYLKILHCQITKNTLETHCHTVWPLISFFKQRVALDVLHCLTSHLSFSWLLGIYIGNAPTQQKTVIVRIFSWAGYLQQNLILIHVILRDGTDPGCTHSECTSALKCLLSPRTQTVKGLRVISHSVMILFRNDMGLERSLGDFRENNNILVLLKLWVLLLLLGKPCTCQINAKVFAY